MYRLMDWKWIAGTALLAICCGVFPGSGQSAWAFQEETAEPGTPKNPSLIEPFPDLPTLAELDAQADWQPQPVLDSLELLRQRLATQPVTATVDEALKLRNTSEEENAKILSALGQFPKSPEEVDWDAGIIRHSAGDVRSTNPILISSTIEFDVLGLTGIGLIGSDWQLNPIAARDVVVSWQTSADRMYDKFVLRDDLTWSDGEPITAHDIVFSFETIMDTRVPVPAVRSGTDKLRWVEAYDDHTVVFFHKESLATNVWNISFPIIPKHIYEESIKKDYNLTDSNYHVKYENNPVCGGAYTIAKRIRGQEIVLKRRESWYMHNGKQVRDKPYFDEVRFRIVEDKNTALLALKKGELEEMQLSPEQWMTQTDGDDFYDQNTKATAIEWTYFYFGWNLESPFFSDKRVRQAMSYAFDYEEMLEVLNYGLYQPCNGIYHETAWMYPKDPPAPYTQDLDKAEELLDAAGWTDHDGDGIRDKDGMKFEFTILSMNTEDRLRYCSLLKQNLQQIGVICNVAPLEFTVLMEKTRTHDFQAFFGGWGTGADPDTSENLWATGEGRNFVNYSNPEVDELFKQGRREFDKEKRAEIYGKIHNILYEDQPYTWLYFRNSFYGFNKELRGYNFSPRGPFNYGPGFSAIWKPVDSPLTPVAVAEGEKSSPGVVMFIVFGGMAILGLGGIILLFKVLSAP